MSAPFLCLGCRPPFPPVRNPCFTFGVLSDPFFSCWSKEKPPLFSQCPTPCFKSVEQLGGFFRFFLFSGFPSIRSCFRCEETVSIARAAAVSPVSIALSAPALRFLFPQSDFDLLLPPFQTFSCPALFFWPLMAPTFPAVPSQRFLRIDFSSFLFHD